MPQTANMVLEKQIKIICVSGNTNVNADKIKKFLKRSKISFKFRSTYEGKEFVIRGAELDGDYARVLYNVISGRCTGNITLDFDIKHMANLKSHSSKNDLY